METKEIVFDRVSFRIDSDGDLEIGMGDDWTYLKPNEIAKLRDFIDQQERLRDLMERAAELTEGMDIDPDAPIDGEVALKPA